MKNIKRVLVTGGAGNVGASLVNRLVDLGEYNITVVDNLSTGNLRKLENVINAVDFIKCNVNSTEDLSQVFLGRKFDYIFHYAAVVGVKRTTDSPVDVLDDIKGLFNVFNLAKNTGVKKIFFSSSSEVYGEPVDFPQNEVFTPLNSRLPYAVVKNIGECFCKAYAKEYNLRYTIFRFFNTYGPLQSEDFVVSRFVRKAIKNQPIMIYGDGLQTRTFLYIDDNLDCVQKILEEELFDNEVVNIGSNSELSVKELAELVIKVCNSQSEIVHCEPLAEGDMRRRQADNSRMMSVLNRPLVDLEAGISLLRDYFSQHSLD